MHNCFATFSVYFETIHSHNLSSMNLCLYHYEWSLVLKLWILMKKIVNLSSFHPKAAVPWRNTLSTALSWHVYCSSGWKRCRFLCRVFLGCAVWSHWMWSRLEWFCSSQERLPCHTSWPWNQLCRKEPGGPWWTLSWMWATMHPCRGDG